MGEYPINGKSERRFSWELHKGLDAPAARSYARDAGEGGGRTASATSMFVMAAEGAKGNGSKGTSLNMMTVFGVGVFFLSYDEEFCGQN